MDLAEVKVVAIGAGGHGSEMNAYMADLRRAGWRGEFLGFLDDTQPAGHSGDMELLGSIADFAARWRSSAAEFRYIAAIGDNQSQVACAGAIDAGIVNLVEDAMAESEPNVAFGRERRADTALGARSPARFDSRTARRNLFRLAHAAEPYAPGGGSTSQTC